MDTFTMFLLTRDPATVAAESFGAPGHREMLAKHDDQRARYKFGLWASQAKAVDEALGPERLDAAYQEQKHWHMRSRAQSPTQYTRNPDRWNALVEQHNKRAGNAA